MALFKLSFHINIFYIYKIAIRKKTAHLFYNHNKIVKGTNGLSAVPPFFSVLPSAFTAITGLPVGFYFPLKDFFPHRTIKDSSGVSRNKAALIIIIIYKNRKYVKLLCPPSPFKSKRIKNHPQNLYCSAKYSKGEDLLSGKQKIPLININTSQACLSQ